MINKYSETISQSLSVFESRKEKKDYVKLEQTSVSQNSIWIDRFSFLITNTMKTVYIFQCSDNKNKYAFSSDNSPINIPHEYCTGEWDGIKEIIISENSPAVIGNSAKKILTILSEKNYFITEVHSDSLEQ